MLISQKLKDFRQILEITLLIIILIYETIALLYISE